jgi:3-hydroxy-9,10-secoandrosta-1,3,5(10)-triene-9,17-dione monooxygenase
MFPEQAQQEYWAASVDTLSSTGLNPAGAQVTVVEGGYRLSGHWDFSSGCDDSTWALVAGIGPEGMLYFLVPRADYVIEDTWFVSGLRGTGSKDITMDNVFVPQHRALLQAHMKEGQTPGRDLHGTPNFRIPHLTVFAYTLAAPIVGMAQGALDAFEAHMRDRVDITTGETMAEFGTVQIRLAESAAEIDAARTIMQQDGREVFARARRDELPTLDDRARYRRNQGYVVKLSVQAVERLFQASGGHTIFDSSPVQRFHRDAHAASHHIAISWDILAEQYGRVRLGLEPKSTSNL